MCGCGGGYMCVDVGVDWGGGGYVDVYCLYVKTVSVL